MTPNVSIPPSQPLLRSSENAHIYDYLSVILRRRKLFALAFCAVFFSVVFYTYFMNPIYEASSTLHIKKGKEQGGLFGMTFDSSNSIDAELEIIKSRTNVEHVVKSLHLDWQVTKKSESLAFKLLDFSSTAKNPSYQIEITGVDTFTVKDDDENLVGQGKAGELMKGKGMTLLLTDLRARAGDSFRLKLLPLQNLAMSLKGGFKAIEVGNRTSIIRISYSSTDPVQARDLVNTLVQVYLAQSIELKTEEASRTVGFVEEQLQSLRGELDSSEKNLQAYKSSSGVIKLDHEAEALITKISEKEKARAELEVQKQALLTDYTEAHPAVKALAKQQETVDQQLAFYERKMRKLPEAERDLARLTRISKVSADIYTFLLQKHEEARIAKASTVSNINIVDPAITPSSPIKPDKPKNLLLGFLVGCMLGIGLAFFQEYLDDTIKDAEEAKRAIGLPLLAVIPFIPSHAENGEAKKHVSLITRLEPKSQVAEAFRSLRTSLHFSAINRNKKIILITSTFPGEGKSIITANLANTLAQTGVRVLVVDCDLRRSSLHERFGVSKVPGLTEVLTGDTTFQKVLHGSVIPGVDLISAGTTPPNPAELLGSEVMRQFLVAHREDYDHILIDAPPVLAVTDAPVLTTLSDMVLVIVEAGRVPVKAAQYMREMLANVQAPTTGFIMNDKTGRGETYGYYGSRYYRYGGYGRKYGHGYGYGYGYYSDDESKPPGKIAFWQKIPFWKKFLPSRKKK
jgi:tyrosine-protein kinase Etk/Wzc